MKHCVGSSLAVRSQVYNFQCSHNCTYHNLSYNISVEGTAVLNKGSLCFADQKEIIYFRMLR